MLYLLYESASGFALFERVKSEEIGIGLDAVQASVTDLARFSKMVKLKAFRPFESAENALENMNMVSEGELTKYLSDFLEMTLGKKESKSKMKLGVVDPKIGNVIQEALGVKCESSEVVLELLRGIRLHFCHFIKALRPADLAQAQLGLGHSYSRSKVKFNVNRVDNMIIQSICLLDQLDKDLNTFAMRALEWYSWHFPELVKIVNDNIQFCRLAMIIKDRSKLTADALGEVTEVVNDPLKAQEVLDAARMSMGQDISAIDLTNIEHFATRVVKLAEYREELHSYLNKKMSDCAPNLAALIGEMVGARLISHAGSLTNLAKYPASTVQILGAEKALFRSLKTKGNTPKYGLIFHSSFIGKATPKNKGRIARYLANKCSLAARIDSFSESGQMSEKFGAALRDQVEERLTFYKTGEKPRKNVDVMKKVLAAVAADDADAEAAAAAESAEPKKKKSGKSKKKAADAEEAEVPAAAMEESKAKVEKKSKKRKAEAEAEAEAPAEPASEPAADDTKASRKKSKIDKAAAACLPRAAAAADDEAARKAERKKVKQQKKQTAESAEAAEPQAEAEPAVKKEKKKKKKEADED